MAEQDTHCTRCGAKLQPTPSFTQMLWTCGCGGQTKPQMGRNRVPGPPSRMVRTRHKV